MASRRLPLIAKWGPLIGAEVRGFFVQKMTTKWGSYTPASKSIRLNTDLAKKPLECLEYIVVHEMAHLLVRHHNDRFGSLVDKYLANWKVLRQTFNETPVGRKNGVARFFAR
jgi:predicted metal-dependent hydrolase